MGQKNLSTLTAILVLAAVLILAPSAFCREKININTASAEQLTQLSGIGPALAERIVDFREHNGAFLNIQDIMLVRGIGVKMFEAIKDQITV